MAETCPATGPNSALAPPALETGSSLIDLAATILAVPGNTMAPNADSTSARSSSRTRDLVEDVDAGIAGPSADSLLRQRLISRQDSVFSMSSVPDSGDRISSTPNTPTSFSFSPVSLRASSSADDSQPGSSYGSASLLDPSTPGTSYGESVFGLSTAAQDPSDKGKARAFEPLPESPSLPPLSFSPTRLLPRVSTVEDLFSDATHVSGLALQRPEETAGNVSAAALPGTSTPLTRSRSVSSMSSRSSRSASMSVIKGKLTKTKVNLTNKLLRRKTLAIDKLLDDSPGRPLASLTFEHASSHADSRYATVPGRLRKTRAYTSPFPMATHIIDPDFEVDADDDLSNTIVLAPRSQFDYKLPRELKLHIFETLLRMHEADHDERVRNGSWTVAKSGRERYVGREKGMKEFFKLSRVSRSWQTLVFDGQLWGKLDLHAFPQIPAASINRLFRFAGPFIRQVDLRGHASLSVPTVRTLASSICLAQLGMTTPPISQLTELNLQGCKSILSTVLHEIILKSPGLKRVSLKGLAAANNTTCVILASTCSQLSALDVSRCRNIDASGIISIASAPRRAYSKLIELRLCGLIGVDAGLMTSLARGAPLLEILDLSYSSGLNDSDLDPFISWREEWDCPDAEYPLQNISLSAREMGYDPADQTRYFKRLTTLRHLNLTCCRSLTDAALGHLAYAVPKLESLEIAGIGDELEDEGVVRLLRTTPLIRRLDLEDASRLSDAILEVLTPVADEPRSRRGALVPAPAQPGQDLEHLVLSSCTRLTTSGMLPLIRACTHLRVLELDGTRAGGAVVREFVRQARRRGIAGAEVNGSDCRGLPGENLVRELAPQTRRRRGWRAWDARRLRFVDPDECDESRVVFKSFWTWQAVDAERAARDKRLRAAIAARGGGDCEEDELAELLEAEELLYRDPADARAARSRWARTLGQLSPTSESCVVM